MASLVREYTKGKLTGQIFTPFFIVNKILDDVGYDCPEIIRKTILDPACGDGRFLIKIVERIIKFSPENKLAENLSYVYGWDIDADAITIAIEKLNKLILPYGINVNWNIKILNSLHKRTPSQQDLFTIKEKTEIFDFIVGNPPYIRIQHLDINERKFIQKNYCFCKSGSTDIYIAFYEMAANLLKENGKSGFITPNTFFYTDTAKILRKDFEIRKNIIQITNYKHIQLFEDATTYSAIVIFDKNERKNFLYQSAINQNLFKERQIDFSELQKKISWQLSINKSNNHKKGKRLGDITNIHVGITTLADRIYTMPLVKFDDNYIYLRSKYNGTVKLEKSILKPIIKVSTFKNTNEPIKEYILFPYKKINEKNKIIFEQELQEKFPLTYKYLLSVKNILNKRDNGKPNSVSWYAFGRSQGLDTSFGEKILFSPMNKKPNFIYHKNKEATFYSGYCIKYSDNYEMLIKQLNSKRMEEFIKISARDFRGGWKAYNKKIVQEFIIYDRPTAK